MSTPTLLIEVFVAGIQAWSWLGLVLLAIYGRIPSTLPSIPGLEVVGGVAATVIAYTLGVLVDRVADSAFEWLERRLRDWKLKKLERTWLPPETFMRLWVFASDGGDARFLNYQRSRIRIARATMLNLLLLLATAAAIYFWCPVLNKQLVQGRVVTGLLIGAPAALLVAMGAWLRIGLSHIDRLSSAFMISWLKWYSDKGNWGRLAPQKDNSAAADGSPLMDFTAAWARWYSAIKDLT